jgi:hypothetical protein
MGLDELQDIRSLSVGLLKPVEGLFVVTKTEVSVHKCGRRYVARFRAAFQFREELQCIGAPTGVGVSSDQYAGCSWTP